MAISLDLSQRSELGLLAALVREVARAAEGAAFFLAGAYARDVLLLYAHGIDTGRQTADVDLAIAVESWQRYDALRAALIARGFSPIPPALHKLQFQRSVEVDFVPFGGVERPDRTIAWPPDGSFVMRAFGFREVQAHTISVGLPDATAVEVATLPALTLLKLVAWSERRYTEPGKDAHDLSLILRHYLEAGNSERLYTEAEDLLNAHLGRRRRLPGSPRIARELPRRSGIGADGRLAGGPIKD